MNQPIHTFIEGAHKFSATRCAELGAHAIAALDAYAAGTGQLGALLGVSKDSLHLASLDEFVRRQLSSHPVLDFRIDFEDGYGYRPDGEEDQHAVNAGRCAAQAAVAGTLPACIGIRTKPFEPNARARSLRTVELFVSALVEEFGGGLPAHVVINLAKVTDYGQVAELAGSLGRLEERLGLSPLSLRMEVMIESPRALVAQDGRSPLLAFRDAAESRLRSACFGPYDYTTSLGIAPSEQRLRHPACDWARQSMLASYAATEVWLADGSTSMLPAVPEGTTASDGSRHVHNAWRMHYDDVRHSLASGYYQGWDVHPAQLPTRFAAVYIFFREGFDAAASRIRTLLANVSQSTILGAVFDDPATGQALLAYIRRAINAGVISETEAIQKTALALDELPMTFADIVKRRSA